jgi:hypothetical protein
MANPPSKSKTKESIRRYHSNAKLLGPRPLLVREDAVSYDELFARFRAAVKPVDIFDEMFVADMVSLQCDILRCRRLKSAVVYMCQAEALKKFLRGKLNYRQYITDEVVENILDNARDNLTATVTEEELAKRELIEPKAAESLADEIIRSTDISHLSTARKYLRGEPKTVALVDKLFAKHGVNLEAIAAEELSGQLPEIAQIDRVAENAENRRNAILREIDRRRAFFAETLRRTVQEVEDAEYQVIETPPTKGKH